MADDLLCQPCEYSPASFTRKLGRDISVSVVWEGSYDKQSRYTHNDVSEVVEYARLRGVRVMPEFDMPGHAQSWCVGYPELCPSATCLTPLDLSRNSTFARIDTLLAECSGRRASTKGQPHGLFPEHFMHLGGDEVSTGCWSSTPRIAAWLKAQKMTADIVSCPG